MKKFDPQAAKNPDLTTNPAYRFLGTEKVVDSEKTPGKRGEQTTKTAPMTAAATGSRTPWNTTEDRKESNSEKILLYTTTTIVEALQAAKKSTGKRVNQLINEMLTEELRLAGYIK